MTHNYLLAAGPHPIFRIFSRSSGVDNLDASITLNGTTKTPIMRYKGGDADGTDWDHWTYGEVLDLQVGTAPTYNDGSPCLGRLDDSVKFNAGGFYKADNNSFGDLGTDDFLIETIFKWETTNSLVWVDKRVGAGDNGWRLVESADKFRFIVEDGVANQASVFTDALINNTWYHAVLAVNRDEASADGAQWYVNGVASGAGADFSAVGDLDSVLAFAIGARSGGFSDCNGSIAYFAIYTEPSWLASGAGGQTEVAAVAAQRFAEVAGYYPQVAFGTPTPTVNTRAFEAYLDKMEDGYSKLYYTGSEWLRMCSRNDLDSVEVQGYFSEREAENLITESEDCDTTWTLITSLSAGDSTDPDAAVCPDGRTVGDGIIAGAVDTQHGFAIDVTLTADTYVFSVFASPGDQDWIKLDDSTIANGWCYFDVDTGAVGTSGAGATGYIEGPFSADAGTTTWYRCCIVFTGTVAAHTLEMMAAVDDNDDDFAGDGVTTNTYFWGMQCELSDYMSSPIITDGATATRLGDDLRFVAGDNIGGEDISFGCIVCDILMPNYAAVLQNHAYTVDDSHTADDFLYFKTRTDDVRIYSKNTVGSAGICGVAVDTTDGYKHSTRMNWETDNFTGYVDDVTLTDDDAAMPDGLDVILPGSSKDGAGQLRGLLSDLRIIPYPTTEDKS